MNVFLLHILASSSGFYQHLKKSKIQVRGHVLPGFYFKHAKDEFALPAGINFVDITDQSLFFPPDSKTAYFDAYTAMHKMLNSDVQLFHMSQRTIFNTHTIGSRLLLFTRYSFNIYLLLLSTNTDVVFFGVPPHSVYDYLWYCIAKYMNLKCFIFENHTYLPSRSNVYDEAMAHIPCCMNNDDLSGLSESMFKAFLTTGRPLNMSNVDCPITVEVFRKWGSTIHNRDKLSVSKLKPYVAFFLCFEPESSTNPMGGIFYEQRLAVEYLRYIVPENIPIIIKDHPMHYEANCKATYLGVVDPQTFRQPEFFESMLLLSNVHFLDSNIKDANSFISNSLCTVSIGGTITIDSILRGVPSIVCGHSSFSRLPGVININSIQRDEFSKRLKQEYNAISRTTGKDILEDYLLASFPCDPYGPSSDLYPLNSPEARMRNELILATCISYLARK